MKPVLVASFKWLQSHSHAILGTVVAMQNSGIISQNLQKPLRLLSAILGAL